MFRRILMKRLASSSAVAGAAAAIFLAGVLAAGEPMAQGTSDPAGQREFPEDLPGTPAAAKPDATPAAPVEYATFTSIQVNVATGGINILGDAANEPSIAVDPTFPNSMAIGWRQFDTVASNFRQAGWAYTTDGGRSWTFPGVLEPGVFRSDPVLGFDRFGSFYYNSLKVIGNSFTCDVFKSVDGGRTWGLPVFAYGGDKQWMTIDRTGGVGDGHIYCAWSLFGNNYSPNQFSRSVDAGASFSFPIQMPLTPIWGTLAVAADGKLYVAGVNPNNSSQFPVIRSSTARDELAILSFDQSTTVSLGGSLVSFAGGNSPNPGGLHGQVWIAVDRSTEPTAGNLYLLCSVDPPGGDPLDINFARSTDGGLTWSAPIRINDDTPGAWQWFGTMSVAPNGRIDVIWNDTRNSGLFNISELFYSFSLDGGETWSANQQLSPPFNSHIGWPNQDKIGDYYDMVSDEVGAHVAWAATFNNEQDVYYLRINDYDCNTNGVGDSIDIANGTSYDQNGDGIPDECQPGASGIGDGTVLAYRLYQNVPNPFNPATTIHFEVPPGGGRVKLRVFDVSGRLVRTLVDGYRGEGTATAVWNGRDTRGQAVSSGIYFYRLEAPGFAQTRKMVFLK